MKKKGNFLHPNSTPPMDDILDHLLHTQGYLPPRNEEEFDEFEKEFSKVKVKRKIHIDIDEITKQ